MASSWTESEKEKLLCILKKHGSSNASVLAAEMGTKSEPQVRKAIKFYEFQGRQSLKEDNLSQRRKAPVDKWIHIMKQLTAGEQGSGSADLATVFKIFAMEESLKGPTNDDEINFKDLYLILADLTLGKAPRTTNDKTNKFLIETISKIAHECRQETTKEERSLVKDLNAGQIREKHRLRKGYDESLNLLDDDDDEETDPVEEILTRDFNLNPLQIDDCFFLKKTSLERNEEGIRTRKILKAMEKKLLL